MTQTYKLDSQHSSNPVRQAELDKLPTKSELRAKQERERVEYLNKKYPRGWRYVQCETGRYIEGIL